MCKKKKEVHTVPVYEKPVSEMSDIEFITYADYLSSPYYSAYMYSQGEYGKTVLNDNGALGSPKAITKASEDKAGIGKHKRNVPKNDGEKAVKSAKNMRFYDKKRGFALFLITLFTLLSLVAIAIGSLGIESIEKFVALYVQKGSVNKYVGELDPALGLARKVANVELESIFYNSYLANIPQGATMLTLVCLYAVPVASVLFVLFAFVGFIKSLCALFSAKTVEGYYKKYKFGFISIVMFLCALIMLVGGLYVGAVPLPNILNAIKLDGEGFGFGYALYAYILIPILTLICSVCAYRKAK